MEFEFTKVIYFVFKDRETPLKEAVTQILHFRYISFAHVFANTGEDISSGTSRG